MPAGANVCAIFKETCLGPRRSTPFPVAGFHTPAIALSNPLMGNPMVSGAGRRPVARDPFMPIAHPVPIAAQPNVAGGRWVTDNLDARHGRRDHYHPIGIVPLIGNDHARNEYRRKQAGCQTRDQALTLLHNGNHRELRVLSNVLRLPPLTGTLNGAG